MMTYSDQGLINNMIYSDVMLLIRIIRRQKNKSYSDAHALRLMSGLLFFIGS